MTARMKIFLVVSSLALGVIWISVRKHDVAHSDDPLHAPFSEKQLSAIREVPARNGVVESPAPESSAETAASPVDLNPTPRRTTDPIEILVNQFDSRLTDDPSLDDFIRNQLWLTLDQLSNPLVKALGLSPAELDEFKTLLVKNLTTAAHRASDALDKGPDAVELQIRNFLAEQQPDLDAQVRRLLGDARFRAYETYRQDYAQFNRVKFLNPREPLSDEQAEQVLDAVIDERQLVNSAAAQARVEEGASPQSFSPEERASEDFAIQQLINERVQARLESVLSPDRLATFAEIQARALETPAR